MAIIAKESKGSSIPPLTEGIYQAICTRLVDIGVQKSEKFGNSKQKIMLGWQILGETVEVNGEETPRVFHKEYGNSLHEKSGLRKDLQAWRGRAFTSTELAGFDMKNILHVPCQMQIIHNQGSDGNIYANIASIMGFPKGMVAPKAHELIYFDLSEPDTFSMWTELPKFIQEKIKKAENYADSGIAEYINKLDNGETPQGFESMDGSEDDLPF